MATCPKATPSPCFGGCFDLQTANRHCGKCGHACAFGESCVKGRCLGQEPPTPEKQPVEVPWEDSGQDGGTTDATIEKIAERIPERVEESPMEQIPDASLEQLPEESIREQREQVPEQIQEKIPEKKPVETWAISPGTGATKGIEVDGSGNVFAVGYFSDSFISGTIRQKSKGLGDLFVVKLDAKGSVTHFLACGGTEQDLAVDLTLDGQGGVYVVGYFHGKIACGGKTLLPTGKDPKQRDLFVLKLDTQLRVVWAKSFGNAASSAETIQRIRTYYDTSKKKTLLYLLGTFSGTALFSPQISRKAAGKTDTFLLQMDGGTGAVLALNTLGSFVRSTRGYGLALDAKGMVYITGAFNTILQARDVKKPLTLKSSHGNINIFLIKYDPFQKAYIWGKSFGSISALHHEEGQSLVVNAKGEIYLTGFIKATNTFGSTALKIKSQGIRDIFVAKLNASGSFVWATSIRGSSQDKVSHLVYDANGNLYVLGSIGNTKLLSFEIGRKTPTIKGSHTILAKLDAKGSITSYSVYPKPLTTTRGGLAIGKWLYFGNQYLGSPNIAGKPLPLGQTTARIFIAKVKP